jgi:hypothetical protein
MQRAFASDQLNVMRASSEVVRRSFSIDFSPGLMKQCASHRKSTEIQTARSLGDLFDEIMMKTK